VRHYSVHVCMGLSFADEYHQNLVKVKERLQNFGPDYSTEVERACSLWRTRIHYVRSPNSEAGPSWIQ
jgi:hypothetical protein